MNHPVSIITGAGSGIGAACARMLAARGHSIVLVGRRAHALHAVRATLATHAAHEVIAADVSHCESAYAVIDETIAKFGRVDSLVLAAGVAPRAPIEATTQAILDETFFTNTFGSAYLITRVWPQLIKQQSGRIALISTLGTSDPFTGFFAYAASKSAVDSFARSIRAEGQPIGVHGFAINPGCVETAQLRRNFPESMVPAARALPPEAIAEVVVACVCGERDEDSGSTIVVASP